MDDRERELADAAAELSETLEALRSELEEPARGPLGIPRPPSPGELLRFTEEYTIPAVIALLESSIRVLELLSAAIRVADGRPLEATDGVLETGIDGQRDKLEAASRTTLRRLDDVLAELQSAAAGGEPDAPEVRQLLEEARGLRSEVDERLDEATPADDSAAGRDGPGERSADSRPDADSGGPISIDVGEPTDSDDADDGEQDDVDIDIEGELESIKQELDAESGGADDAESSDPDPDAGDTDGRA
jgi:hypothetical protein